VGGCGGGAVCGQGSGPSCAGAVWEADLAGWRLNRTVWGSMPGSPPPTTVRCSPAVGRVHHRREAARSHPGGGGLVDGVAHEGPSGGRRVRDGGRKHNWPTSASSIRIGGTQYTTAEFRKVLTNYKVLPSVGRIGLGCWDDACRVVLRFFEERVGLSDGDCWPSSCRSCGSTILEFWCNQRAAFVQILAYELRGNSTTNSRLHWRRH
jgi:hypothetical protein